MGNGISRTQVDMPPIRANLAVSLRDGATPNGFTVQRPQSKLEDQGVSSPVYVESRLKMATSVDAKLLKQTKFPPEFNQKVDMKEVNVEVMKK